MKIHIEPQAMTWSDAKSFATYKGGRLPSPREFQQMSKSRALTVDIWANEENQDAPESAKYWSRKFQAIMGKEKDKLCLVVYVTN